MNEIKDWYGRKSKILIATDHGGVDMKKFLIEKLSAKGREVGDLGPYEIDPADDYCDYACKVALPISKGEADLGILVCRSGVGMSVNANRFHNVRAVVASDVAVARASRGHNCSNVLILPADYIDNAKAWEIVDAWLSSPFSAAERHARRLQKIEENSWDEIAPVRGADPQIARLLDAEVARQVSCIELIASENFASAAVRAAQGSVLTNKYAEGYPQKRYYNGCEVVDEVESLAIKRVCELFGAEAANVQPHSGSQANMAAYFALIQPGDTILAMDLAHGGHLTHGHPMNFSGMMYKVIPYGVDPKTEMIDYDNVERLAVENKPKLLVAGASAYPRFFDFARLRAIADKVGAKLMFDMAHVAGLVAAGLHPNPVPHCDVVTSTTHKTLRGPRSGLILCREQYLKEVNSKLFPGIQGGPLMHVIAAKAVCFGEAMTDGFKAYQKQVIVNASLLAKELAGKGFRIVSGGTDNHLMLVDLRPKKSTGKVVALALDKAGVTVNKNMIPFDPEKPFVTSGIRIGTPAVTTRGMKEPEMVKIAGWINEVVSHLDDEAAIKKIGDEVRAFASKFPMPGI